jgi:SAM-dependent methyltransferase
MNIKIAGGAKEDGIVIGNTFDKYGSNNPVVKWMMNGFERALSGLIAQARPASIHEIGCGEGYWVLRWNEQGIAARGCDFSAAVIDIARENSQSRGLPPISVPVTTAPTWSSAAKCSSTWKTLKPA